MLFSASRPIRHLSSSLTLSPHGAPILHAHRPVPCRMVTSHIRNITML